MTNPNHYIILAKKKRKHNNVVEKRLWVIGLGLLMS